MRIFMNLIVAADENWAIGNKNELLVRIPADQKFFRETTMGKVVVMGRKTLETFPNGLPLMGRTNIVLTHDKKFRVPGALIVHDMEELHEELEKYNSEDIYVIGGESVYRQLIDECDVAHVTKIDFAYDADAHFPDLDADPAWEITADSEEQTYFDLEYYFYRYERVRKQVNVNRKQCSKDGKFYLQYQCDVSDFFSDGHRLFFKTDRYVKRQFCHGGKPF